MAADRLGISRQAVQRIADELAGEGLAVFDDNPRHRRSPFLRLSEKGRRVLAAISEEARQRNTALAELASLDVAETRAALGQLTTAVRAQLDGNSEGRPR